MRKYLSDVLFAPIVTDTPVPDVFNPTPPVTSNENAGLVVPIPTLPLSNIDPVATVEADENLTT